MTLDERIKKKPTWFMKDTYVVCFTSPYVVSMVTATTGWISPPEHYTYSNFESAIKKYAFLNEATQRAIQYRKLKDIHTDDHNIIRPFMFKIPIFSGYTKFRDFTLITESELKFRMV